MRTGWKVWGSAKTTASMASGEDSGENGQGGGAFVTAQGREVHDDKCGGAARFHAIGVFLFTLSHDLSVSRANVLLSYCT